MSIYTFAVRNPLNTFLVKSLSDTPTLRCRSLLLSTATLSPYSRFRTSLVRVDSLEVHRRRLAQAKERRGRSDDSSGDSSLEYPHGHPDGRLRAIDFDGVTAVIPPPSRALARLRDHNEQGDRDLQRPGWQTDEAFPGPPTAAPAAQKAASSSSFFWSWAFVVRILPTRAWRSNSDGVQRGKRRGTATGWRVSAMAFN